MTTHSSILSGKIPWTEEPGRLQSTESQRVGHHEATEQIGLLRCDVFPVTVSFSQLFVLLVFSGAAISSMGLWQYFPAEQKACLLSRLLGLFR